MFSVITPNGTKMEYKMPVSTKPNPLPEVREPLVVIPEMLKQNPPYNYNKKRPAPRKPRTEHTVVHKPIEQYTEEERLIHTFRKKIKTLRPIPSVQWDLHYNRIHDKKKRKWFYRMKTGDEPEPEVKQKVETSKWKHSRLAEFMNANFWKNYY